MFLEARATTKTGPSSTRRSRARLAGPLVFAILLGLCATAPTAFAQAPAAEVDDAYVKSMRRYLEIQGRSVSYGQQVAYGAANETLMAIANNGIEVTETMQNIVVEEAISRFGKKLDDLDYLTSIMAPVYARHFTREELDEMSAFWDSPIGRKNLEIGAVLGQESLSAVQKVTFEITPAFQAAIDQRFKDAKVNLTPAPPPTPLPPN